MIRISRAARCWLAIAIWATGILLFLALAAWNISASHKDAENRLINEAGRAAAQIAAILAHPGSRLDMGDSRAITGAAMEDERIYAIKVETRNGILAGLRRNYLWEPVPWDDELADNCARGTNPIKINGQNAGQVEVWLSPRLSEEENSLLEWRERLRFLVLSSVWTVILFLLLWHWGDFRRLRKLWLNRENPDNGEKVADLVLGLARADKKDDQPKQTIQHWIDGESGRQFQRQNPEAWLVTAGMFRQTFGRAPSLISRLFAEGETAGLCHLGRMLEQAAPCVGAKPLAQAAREMQDALNNPACKTRALPVEKCARILERTLEALGGKQTESGA